MKITPIQLAKRVEKWGKTLATLSVAHFEFELSISNEKPDSAGNKYPQASVLIDPQYDKAWFWFYEDYLDCCTEDQLDQTIIHEWLHVAMRDFDFTMDLVETWMPEATYDSWEQTVTHEREGLVERLATTLFQLYADQPPRFTP